MTEQAQPIAGSGLRPAFAALRVCVGRVFALFVRAGLGSQCASPAGTGTAKVQIAVSID